MIPYLYPQTQEKITPLNGYNSIGRLSDCISCKITEDLSGVYEMELKYPTNGKHAQSLLVGYNNSELTIDTTRKAAYINASGNWSEASDSYSVCIPVAVNARYILSFTNAESGTVGTIFRYGFSSTNTPTGQQLTNWVRTTPQSTPNAEVTASDVYLVVQMSTTYCASNINNGYFKLFKQENVGMIAAVMPSRTLRTSSPEVGNVAKRLQLFDIRRRVVQDDIITLSCLHISYRLNNYCSNGIYWGTSPPHTLSATMNTLLGHAVPTMTNGSYFTPFSWRDTFTGNRPNNFESVATKSVRAFLIDSWYSIQSEYKVEIQFDNWEVQIFTQRGKDEGYEVRLGKNFARGEYDKDETETFNALVPYWVRENVGKVVCNPLLVQPTTPITPIKAVVKDFTNAFDNQPSAAELETYARAYLDNNTPWIPHETTHIEIYPLNKFGKLNHEVTPELALGDTLTVYWGDANVVGQKMRIVSAVFDSLKEEYETLELGDIQKGYVLTGEW